MRCPNCNDVKKHSDQDDVLCDYCYEASHSDRVFVFEGQQNKNLGGISALKFLQKTTYTADVGMPQGTVMLWDGRYPIPEGFDFVDQPVFNGQNQDFVDKQLTYPYGNWQASLTF
jgi:hypothetical protein